MRIFCEEKMHRYEGIRTTEHRKQRDDQSLLERVSPSTFHSRHQGGETTLRTRRESFPPARATGAVTATESASAAASATATDANAHADSAADAAAATAPASASAPAAEAATDAEAANSYAFPSRPVPSRPRPRPLRTLQCHPLSRSALSIPSSCRRRRRLPQRQ